MGKTKAVIQFLPVTVNRRVFTPNKSCQAATSIPGGKNAFGEFSGVKFDLVRETVNGLWFGGGKFGAQIQTNWNISSLLKIVL
jgi:hypothetical protein